MSIIAEIRTLWSWLRGDCVECGHSHYNYEHQVDTQLCPRGFLAVATISQLYSVSSL